jgi:hypothetical protein
MRLTREVYVAHRANRTCATHLLGLEALVPSELHVQLVSDDEHAACVK